MNLRMYNLLYTIIVKTIVGRGYTELLLKLAVIHANFFSGYTGAKRSKRLKNLGFLPFPSSISRILVKYMVSNKLK